MIKEYYETCESGRASPTARPPPGKCINGHPLLNGVVAAGTTGLKQSPINIRTAAVDSAAATAGTYTGHSFTAFDFSAANEDLIVDVDGTSQSVPLATNIVNAPAAVAAINSGLTGAVASLVGGLGHHCVLVN